MRGKSPIDSAAGFTLIELLVTVGIVGLLFALSAMGYARILAETGRIQCLANLRGISVAVNTYMADHDGYYPGPINSGQGVGASSGLLGYVLRDYVGAPDVKIGQLAPKIFICPAWHKLYPDARYGDGRVVYITNHAITVGNGSELATYDPWGYPASLAYPSPMKTAAMAALAGATDYSWSPDKSSHGRFSLSKTWAIADVDVYFTGRPYMSANFQPDKPVHGRFRNVLFFDWHAESLPATFAPDGQLALKIP